MVKVIENETYRIQIGQSAQENWDLIDSANASDIWFHLEKFSSPHLILHIHDGNEKASNKIIFECAQMVHENSKYKNLKNIYVIYTFIKHIKKDSSKVGTVFTSNTKKIKL
jgi:predicted ribosome quality control (RQC) complex YloA/Tae2 family protein